MTSDRIVSGEDQLRARKPDDGLTRYPEGRTSDEAQTASSASSASTHSQPTERSGTPIAAATLSHMP